VSAAWFDNSYRNIIATRTISFNPFVSQYFNIGLTSARRGAQRRRRARLGLPRQGRLHLHRLGDSREHVDQPVFKRATGRSGGRAIPGS
jgi:hypothetical protein